MHWCFNDPNKIFTRYLQTPFKIMYFKLKQICNSYMATQLYLKKFLETDIVHVHYNHIHTKHQITTNIPLDLFCYDI